MGFILPMIGSWTVQHRYNWKVDSTKVEDDVDGKVEWSRLNDDSTTRFMRKTETVGNSTMFLIGRIPLDIEHAMMYKLRRSLRSITMPIQIHGCINDCFFVTTTRKHSRNVAILDKFVQETLTWSGGVQAFRVSGAHHQAPTIEWSYPTVTPKPSIYRENVGPTERPAGAYGAWLSNMPCERCGEKFKWMARVDDEGMGCGPDDIFQAQMVR